MLVLIAQACTERASDPDDPMLTDPVSEHTMGVGRRMQAPYPSGA
jgi:hypothetical protein